jgi:hypothetical protein
VLHRIKNSSEPACYSFGWKSGKRNMIRFCPPLPILNAALTGRAEELSIEASTR